MTREAVIDAALRGRIEHTRTSSTWADAFGNWSARALTASPVVEHDPRTPDERINLATALARREVKHLIVTELIAREQRVDETASQARRRINAYLRREPLQVIDSVVTHDTATGTITVELTMSEKVAS